MQQAIIPVLAHIEAFIDFPDEDISPETGADLLKRLDAVLERAQKLIATSEQGRILRHGARTVISGAPNVGKSSLLNLLLGFERAIVSPTAGTTRDTIEEIIQVHGIPLRLVDTAGLRESTDDIERVGIQRTERELDRADLVIEVVDASQPSTTDTPVRRSDAPPQTNLRLNLSPELASRRILILNKADLGIHPSWSAEPAAIPLSCLTGAGIEPLRDAIREVIAHAGPLAADHPIAINARHKAAFERSAERLLAARAALEMPRSPRIHRPRNPRSPPGPRRRHRPGRCRAHPRRHLLHLLHRQVSPPAPARPRWVFGHPSGTPEGGWSSSRREAH
jgi:tRNA modification GTPase